MTYSMMNLRTLVKVPRRRYLAVMIGFAAERLMELAEGAATCTSYGEKSAERGVQRNRYHKRD